MNGTSSAPSTHVGSVCPRCGASDATLSLLTSMTRYFACRRCHCRWDVSVVVTSMATTSALPNHGTLPAAAGIRPVASRTS